MERIDREFDAFLRHLESDESSEDTEAEDAEVSMWSLLKSPTVHVEENETEMVVTCNFAGMDTENVNVGVHLGTLCCWHWCCWCCLHRWQWVGLVTSGLIGGGVH